MNGISSQKINHMDVGSFWKHNEPILEKLEHQRMPSQSRLVYKDTSTKHNKSKGIYLTQYDLVNFYGNRKNFLKIFVEFGPDLSIRKEEILVANSLSEAKRTTLEGDKVTSLGHVRWLRNMATNWYQRVTLHD
ncbi:MAG: hypothetical protein ACREBI_00505 [Nitrosotalea sp.]